MRQTPRVARLFSLREAGVGINEPTCPFCGAWRPGLYGWAPGLQRLVGHSLDLFSLIVATCVTLYAIALLLQPEAITQLRGMLSILSPGGRALYQLGMTGGLAWQLGWWWTLFTAIYLHGSLLHIVFNVMWIRNLGPSVTEVFGPARAFVLFNLGGAFGISCLERDERNANDRRVRQYLWTSRGADCLWSATRQFDDVSATLAVGNRTVRVRLSHARHQQLGSRRRIRWWVGLCLLDGIH